MLPEKIERGLSPLSRTSGARVKSLVVATSEEERAHVAAIKFLRTRSPHVRAVRPAHHPSTGFTPPLIHRHFLGNEPYCKHGDEGGAYGSERG